ncbi:MAG TPA: alpha-hydroxy acid oxidase [Candidatus Acidoferrum sp.]|nr:alpha-hydroxy acid oxidase [Candidatus Acidoferrum sp.]
MESSSRKMKDRRKFLRMLAASPLLALPGPSHFFLQELLASRHAGMKDALTLFESLEQGESLISSPEQAFDVMDFEPVARKTLPPAHFGFLATGVDDDATVRANREGFTKLQIRSRRLVDLSSIDMSVRLFGTSWDSPIVLSPVGSQRAFHPEGEIAVARAARTKGHLQILSTATSSSVEDVTAARGTPIWYQLYVNNVWDIVRAMIKRAEAVGCPVLVLTVDLKEGSNRETLFRAERADSRQCSMCHPNGFGGFGRVADRPMFAGLDVSKATGLISPALTWDYVKRLKDTTTMKLVLKGIVTREDAQLAVEHGVDGIIVSNHGGRAEETLRSTIESLPEVLEGAARKIPVLVDGGFRRGTDIFKALALGATAVGIGRPYAWGLASFGQPGVEAVLTILRRELQTIMRQAGTTSIDKITSAYLAKRS